jgi:chromosome segregation ATPase
MEEQLASERGRLASEASRVQAELEAERRRVAEMQEERAGWDSERKRLQSEVDDRRRGHASDSAETEKRQAAEVARLKAAMVELERHLESRARAELQLKKKVQELEKAAKAGGASDPGEAARQKAAVSRLEEEVTELRGENDFLNGEVARYVQKNKDLLAQLESMRES